MVDLEVRCSTCDQDLDADFKRFGHGNSVALFVEPCKNCMSEIKQAGYEEGKEETNE